MKAVLSTLFTALLALLAGAQAIGQPAVAQTSFNDPTRPPAGLQAALGASAPEAPEGLVLQSVLLGKGRDSAAVISGNLVPLGGLVGGLRLVQVTRLGVQLKGPEGTTSLSLMPSGQKTARITRTELSK